MNLYGNLADEKAMAGMLYGMNPKTIVSAPAKETINFGRAVFFNGAKNALLNGKHNNKAVIDLSAYTTASKVIKLTINGVDVSVTTTATIATDVASLVSDINDDVSGVTAVAGTSSDAGKIFLTADDDSALSITVIYDGGDVTSSKATLSSDAVYAGIAVFHQNAFINSRGCYVPDEAVNVMEKGYIWGVLADDVTPTIEASAYINSDGKFTTSSSNTILVGKFKSGVETGSNSDEIVLVSLD